MTLVGALPLGLVIAFGSMSHFKPLSWLARLIVWVIRGTPLMIQLLIIYYFPGLVLHNPIWGGGESRALPCGSRIFLSSITPAIFQKSTAVESGCSGRSERSRSCTWHDKASDLFQDHTPSDDQTHCTTDVK